MRLILGLPPPASSPFLPPRSLPRTGPRLRSRSRACFRVYPRAGLCIGPSLVFASVPVPAPVSVPAPRWFLSQSPHRPHFPSSVSAPYRSPPSLRFPRLFPCLPLCLLRAGLCPSLSPRFRLRSGSRACFRTYPAPVSVPVPASVSDPLLSLLLFVPFVPASGYPKSLAAVVLLFPWISLYSVPLLRFFYPASFFFRFVRGGTVVFLNF